ncbi:MAG: phospholipase D-like domain-containing protein [Methylacidiphilaceae bacterium]|nr:phospholipase D-like domain-containing protein [Candidatus Methylacidiphilaceae bacterium]
MERERWRALVGWAGLSLVVLALAACARTPKIALSADPPGDALHRTLAVDAALHRDPVAPGNRVTLLPNGMRTFEAMFAAMEQANDHINLEYYIFEDVRVGARSLGRLLRQKLQAGVAVNVILDGYGSYRTNPAFLERLRKAGARILVFRPLTPEAMLEVTKANDRDHRKILVVDGKVGFVGGVNLARVYENHSDPRAAMQGDFRHAYWSDIAARIEGPAVTDLQRLFFATWSSQHGPTMERRAYFPEVAEAGSERVRVIGSGPGRDEALYYGSFLEAVHIACRSVDLSTGFFVPTQQEVQELARAARRGVAVRLVLPSPVYDREVRAAGRADYGRLLEAGVRIWEVEGAVLHAKFATVDGAWTAVGSSNMDRRSVVYNDEVDAIVFGEKTAGAARAIIEQNIARSREITLDAWRHRNFRERANEFFASFWRFLM